MREDRDEVTVQLLRSLRGARHKTLELLTVEIPEYEVCHEKRYTDPHYKAKPYVGSDELVHHGP